ncbi:MAG TPA: ABC transporter permease [Bacteroidota bacterium]|nr:ABC transporter permease [Bacteroidota bacterium]
MKKALAVAKWEFMEKVKSKAFLISLVLMPVIIVLFAVIPGFLAAKPDDRPLAIGIIDKSGLLFERLKQTIEEKHRLPDGQPNYILKDLGADGDVPQLKLIGNQMIANGEIEGYFFLPADIIDSGKVEYRARNVGNLRIERRFSKAIEDIIVEIRLSNQGYDASRVRNLLAEIDIRSMKISDKGEETESGFREVFFSAYIFIMALMFLVLTSGQLLVRSVVEEKTNRVIEVLLSSCSSMDLMTGKILGLSTLGLVQIGLWGAIGLAVSIKTGGLFFLTENLILSAVYFILGYLMYSAIFVGVGSPITTEQEAQQLTSYVSLFLVFPIALAIPAMQNPDSMLIKVLTFIPILTPTFMLLRIPIQTPATWEIVTTIILLVLTTVVLMWAAGKVFRIAILVYGKRPSIPELFRWIRAA